MNTMASLLCDMFAQYDRRHAARWSASFEHSPLAIQDPMRQMQEIHQWWIRRLALQSFPTAEMRDALTCQRTPDEWLMAFEEFVLETAVLNEVLFR